MHRPFLQVPDPRLREVAAPVEAVTEEVRGLWEEMLLAMYAMPGIGLAAPQLGVLQRVIVVDCSQTGNAAVRMANPEILDASRDTQVHTEGSPNIPGHYGKVARSARVRVAFLDAQGGQAEQVFEGLWATSVQHQIDHLNGVLFIDHLSATKRKMILSKHEKAARRRAVEKG
ncbi:MAG: peptide deformylase [Pseudomonadota bacterium]